MSALAQSATEYFNVGNPIKYCGTEFWLTWSTNPQEDYFIQEYLPKGENLDHYNQMFTVSVNFGDITDLDAIQAKVDELEQRKQFDPVTNYTIAKNDDGEYILEFIVSDFSNNEINTVEIDIHHYKQMMINGRNAIVLEFYSGRAYGDEIMQFIESIPGKNISWYDEMFDLKLKPEFPDK